MKGIKSFRYQVVWLQVVSLQSKVVSPTTFESVRYKHEPKILKVTNLKYCINLFAHDPHMREPNSFAIVDEFMSNLELFLMERHFWRTPCRLF